MKEDQLNDLLRLAEQCAQINEQDHDECGTLARSLLRLISQFREQQDNPHIKLRLERDK